MLYKSKTVDKVSILGHVAYYGKQKLCVHETTGRYKLR